MAGTETETATAATAMSDLLLDTGSSGRGSSFWGPLLHCPRQWALRHLTTWLDEVALEEPLVRGSMIHLVLGHQRLHALGRTEYLAPYDAPAALLADREAAGRPWQEIELWRAWSTKACDVGRRYEQFYGGIGEWSGVSVESLSELRIPCPDDGDPVDPTIADVFGAPLVHTTRIDWVVKQARTGLIWVADTKSYAGRWSTQVLAQYVGSLQIAGLHAHGVARYGDQFGGVMLDFVQADGAKFRRVKLHRDWHPTGLARFPRQIWDAARVVGRHLERDPIDWPGIDKPDGCISRWGTCPAFGMCHGAVP